jgi:hypothetical protein
LIGGHTFAREPLRLGWKTDRAARSSASAPQRQEFIDECMKHEDSVAELARRFGISRKTAVAGGRIGRVVHTAISFRCRTRSIFFAI